MATVGLTLSDAVRYYQSGDLQEAEVICRRILDRHPHQGDALDLRGVISHRKGDSDAALNYMCKAISANSLDATYRSDKGVVHQDRGELAHAEACFRDALRLDPDYAEAHNNLGTILQAHGQPQEALAHYQQALRLRPDYAEANLNQAQALLLIGDFLPGWQGYEWRWKHLRLSPHPFSQPRWDGAPLAGGTILLYAEQGLGDTLQFIRYTALVKKRVGTVIVQCQPALIRLLATCPGIDEVIPEEAFPPRFDVHAPLLSLPGIFRTTLDSIPADVPYLQPPQGNSLSANTALDAPSGVLRVGIVWAGRPTHENDPDRSCPVSCFTLLGRLRNVALFSLQKGPRAEELGAPGIEMSVVDLKDFLGDFADTAAVVARLDLVISVDTAVAHLAGALGKPVWLLLPFAPDWRWLLEREDSPWYPTMRLFRQARPGDWPGVFERVCAALKETPVSHDVSRVTYQQAQGIPPREAGRSTDHPAGKPLAPPPAAAAAAPAGGWRPSRGERSPRGTGEESTEDVITLPSALVDENGRPRFVMRFPTRFRSDPGAAYLYEHETKYGGYEYPSRRFLDMHLQPGDLFIDVGAHWGIYTLTAATRWPNQIAALAVEPMPENASILRANLLRNHLTEDVEVVEAAAGSAAGQATMFRDSSMGHSLYPTGASPTSPHATLTMPVVTLDELITARPRLQGRRTVIKIDAEGYEPEVVEGARRLIESGGVAVVIWEKGALYDAGPHKDRMLGMIEYLRAQQFTMFRFPHENMGGSLMPFVVNQERCNVFALAPGFPIAPTYDKPPGPSAPAVPPAPTPMTAAERAELTKALAAVRGSDAGRWADPASLSPAWDERAARVAAHIPRGARVLDVGAGAMALRRFLDKTVRYIPADIVAREPGCLVADLNQGQFPEGRYDYVTMLGVLEYVHDVPAVLRRARAAAPRAIFTYSLFAGEDRDGRRSLGWFNDYTAEELTTLLAEAGWCVSSVEAIENSQVILVCRDGASSGLCGLPVVPARKRVLVMGYHNAANFGDRLGYHLIPSILPPHCDVSFATFQPWQVPAGPYDLVIVGIGNSLFAPLLTDELQRLVEAAPHSIGIFGTQYRDGLSADRLHRLIDALTWWYARYEEDIFLYGRGHQNVQHLGDWLALLCPMSTPSLAKELIIRPDFIASEAPLDRVIQDIQRYQRVHSARIHPLLVALHSARMVSYEEQREMGDGQMSGKFRSLLLDVFEKSYPEREPFGVNRHLVSAHQARVRANCAHLAAAIQGILGDGKWTARTAR